MKHKLNRTLSKNDWKLSFYSIAVGQSISVISSSAVQFALIWNLASKSASPIILSIVSLSAYLPQVILSPFAGVFIDRINRKKLIILSDLFLGLIALIAAFLAGFIDLPNWLICLILGMRSLVSVFHTPTMQSIFPLIVPKKELIRANGMSQFLHSGAYMIGPILGAAMYSSLPFRLILSTDFIGAMIAFITLSIVSIPHAEKEKAKPKKYLSELKEGFLYYKNDKKLLLVTGTILIGMLFYMPLTSFYRLMINSHFHASAWGAGLQEIVYAMGLMLSSIFFGKFRILKNRMDFVFIGFICLGSSTFICGSLPADFRFFWIFVIMGAVMGASVNLYHIPYITYIQENVEENSYGKVFSLFHGLYSLTMPVGLLFAGPYSEHWGVAKWYQICGIVLVSTSVLCKFILLNYKEE